MEEKISVVIPTWRRSDTLQKALLNILSCDPPPSEVIIHVDAGDLDTGAMLDRDFKGKVEWFQSATTQGPGGGRNLLLRRARFPLVAGFDDDSWPMDKKYFRNVADLFAKLPKIGVVSAQEVNPGKSVLTRASCLIETACFQNGASTIRVKAFLDTDGFLPLQHAYGMEEADVALQLLDHGWSIIHAPDIQVWHNTDFKRHQNPSVNSAHIRNTALLAFLRYPKRYWPLGVIQVLNRLRYALSVGRWQGVGAGIMQIAPVCWKYRKYRKTVHCETIKKSRSLGRNKSG